MPFSFLLIKTVICRSSWCASCPTSSSTCNVSFFLIYLCRAGWFVPYLTTHSGTFPPFSLQPLPIAPSTSLQPPRFISSETEKCQQLKNAGAEDWDDLGHLARCQHHDQWDQGRDAEGKICSKSFKIRRLGSQVTYITMSDAWLYPITYYCCFCLFEFLIVQVPHYSTTHLISS